MNIEPIMEKICDLCHWPYVEPNEDGLKDGCDHCETCTVEAEIRAAMMEVERETADRLGAIQAENAKLTAERDAAVKDISKVAYHERKMPCFVCKHKDAFGDELRKHCQNCFQFNSHFEWRGPQKEG